MNNNTEAQLSQNTLESIVNQTNVLTNAQINVGDGPSSIGGIGDAMYVANQFSNTVSVIDPATNTVIEEIPVGDSPQFIDATRNAVYVANFGSDTVSVIDPATNTVIENITSGGNGPISIDTYRGDVYVANQLSNTVSVIDPTTNTVIENITVGDFPFSINRYPLGDVYVANYGSGTVSVIDPATNTVIENITTAGDSPVFIDTSRGAVYVANSESDTVSVIDPATNTVIENITVGDSPISIHIFRDFSERYQDVVYVANTGSDTVSVINVTTNTVIENITVGDGPASIDTFRGAVYVANFESDTVSVIDLSTNDVVAGVTFDINPFRGGQIICNGLDAPINRYLYVPSGTECVAKPNNGFEFDSWGQIYEGNSTRTINASTTSDWLVDPLAALHNVFIDDPAANLTVNRFGNFTAYFKALPPPVPAAYWASLFTVGVTALIGSLLVPAFVGWLKTKKQTSRLNSFHQKMDKNDTNQLNTLNRNISDSYAAGKINNEQYMHLKNEVSMAYQEIFKKRIESITVPNNEAFREIKNDIKDAYSNGKITELHYNLLNEQISDILSNK